MDIKYRTLIADDILAYREVRLSCLRNYPDYFGTLLENEINSKELKFDSILKREPSSSFLYGAFKQHMLIGICGFTREEKLKTNHRGTISQMYVANEFADLGIGRHLLKLTIEKAFADKTLEIIELGVVSNNLKAIKIYLSFGYREFGKFEKYFKYNNKYCSFTFMALARDDYFKHEQN
ncbi:MAG: GNAT family protein [Ginsengibacter sp.]